MASLECALFCGSSSCPPKIFDLYTDAFDQGFKVIDKAGNRLRHAFGNKMGSWIGRKVEIQVVEYGVGTGCDIFPVDDSGDDDADHSEGDIPDDEAVD